MNHYADDDHMVIAHMSKDELRQLDNLQGGRHVDRDTNLPTYGPLLHLMSQGKIPSLVDDWERSKYAGGGEVEGINQYLRDQGRNGDTEVVKLPRPLAELFDRAIGKPSINPTTGKREYFLGGILSSIGNFLSPITSMASKFLPGVKSAFSSMAPGLASAGMNTLKDVAGQGMQALSSGNFNPASLAKNAFSSAVQNFSPMAGQLAQQGLTALGTEAGAPELGEAAGQFANNMFNNVAPQAANAYSTGQQMPDLGRSTAEQAGNAIQNSSLGQNPYAAGAGRAMQGYGGGMTPQDAAYSGVSHTASQMPNQLAGAGLQAGANAMQAYRGGASPLDAAMSGVRNLSPQMQQGAMNQAANYGRKAYQGVVDRFAPNYS